MRESRTYGSVRGARSNARPYRVCLRGRSFLPAAYAVALLKGEGLQDRALRRRGAGCSARYRLQRGGDDVLVEPDAEEATATGSADLGVGRGLR